MPVGPLRLRHGLVVPPGQRSMLVDRCTGGSRLGGAPGATIHAARRLHRRLAAPVVPRGSDRRRARDPVPV